MKEISIVIVHWNTPKSLSKLLSTVYDEKLDIIVVDNNSKMSIQKIQKSYPNVQFIENQYNRGYAAACNQGATQAQSDWVLFLNPDVNISHDDVMHLRDYAVKKGYDACSPEPQSSDYKKPLPSVLSLLTEFTKLSYITPSLSKNKTLFGGGLLIKKSVLYALGGWDERFFLWFEDSDLTKRLLDKSYTIGWAPIKITHKGGETFKLLSDSKKKGIFFTSMYAYADKHFTHTGKFIINKLRKHYTPYNIPPIQECSASVVVPNMNIKQLNFFLKENIKTLESIEDLIVVSSSLTNENIWKYRTEYPYIRFISILKNKGFAHTVNIGMRASSGSWIGTINDDTVIPSNDWIPKMIQQTETIERIGSLNPTIQSPNNEVESIGVSVLKHGKALPLTKKQSDTPYEVDASNAAAVLYSQDALQKVGLFDTTFGSYLEDIDLSLRLQKKGWINIVVPDVRIIHYGQQTSKKMGAKKQWLDFKNWILVIGKNWTLTDLIRYFPHIIIERLRNLSGIIKSLS